MKNSHKQNNLSANIDLGVRRGVAKALAQHKEAGRSIHIWQDGKVIEIPAKKIKFDKKLLNEE